ncbi:MarR family winged helix-turn-helix transcriptional regulator [Methanosarcina horonobensis]|uniref:MarR family winged helix-turn-helix transcriptional regulator n=1 Tax=Methanosarcina horonobensis TaxID=418008 RepID=UPI000AA0CFAD|nr:winged helix-turn-helix domain-containing protein [Methanosarcina horonobensis]
MTHLTGGSPRLVIFFYELIARDNFEDLEKVFFKILDEHTPYYREIFQLLTGQKRLIFDTIISSESPMTPKQIAEKSRIDASTVITQLRRLEKDGYVLSRPAGRETFYEVRERLFRLWRDMRQPLGRNRISVFLDFLKLWYTSEEQKEIKKITSNESLEIVNTLKLVEAYLSLDKVVEAITEIELVKSKIVDQEPYLIEEFINLCWKIIFKELIIKNLGSGKKHINIVFDLKSRLKKRNI